MKALQDAGQSVPPPVPIRALIDTGASCTCVDAKVLKTLRINPTGKMPIHTPSTSGQYPHEANQFDVFIVIAVGPALQAFASGTIPVIEAELEHQGYKALIGRDILSKCLMVFEGRGAFLTLAF
jgi:hypothetical protein